MSPHCPCNAPPSHVLVCCPQSPSLHHHLLAPTTMPLPTPPHTSCPCLQASVLRCAHLFPPPPPSRTSCSVCSHSPSPIPLCCRATSFPLHHLRLSTHCCPPHAPSLSLRCDTGFLAISFPWSLGSGVYDEINGGQRKVVRTYVSYISTKFRPIWISSGARISKTPCQTCTCVPMGLAWCFAYACTRTNPNRSKFGGDIAHISAHHFSLSSINFVINSTPQGPWERNGQKTRVTPYASPLASPPCIPPCAPTCTPTLLLSEHAANPHPRLQLATCQHPSPSLDARACNRSWHLSVITPTLTASGSPPSCERSPRVGGPHAFTASLGVDFVHFCLIT